MHVPTPKQLLDALLASAPSGIGYLDHELCYILISPQLAALAGGTPEELRGRALDVVLPGMAAQLAPLARRVLATGEGVQDLELRGRACDPPTAECVWRLSLFPVPGPAGAVDAVGMIVADITASRAAEAAVQASEERFRLLAEHANDLIYRYRLRPTPGFEYVSPSAATLTGYTPEEHYANPQLGMQLVHPDDRPLLEGVAQASSLSGEPLVLRWLRKDGAIIWMEQVNKLILDAAGAPVAIEGIARDITARKEAEAALQASTAKLQAALASMTDAVFIADLAGRFVDFNDAFASFHRFASKQECPRDLGAYPALLDVLLPGGEPVPVEQWPVTRALRGETVANAEYGLRRRDTGATWVGSFSFAPIRDAAGAIIGAVVVGRDITEGKAAETELQRAVARLGALHTIDQAILGAESPGQMAALVLASLRELLPVDQVALIIDHPSHPRLQLLERRDGRADPAQLAAVARVFAHYREGPGPWRPWLVGAADERPELAGCAATLAACGIRALMVAPLLAQGALIGALVLGSAVEGAIGEAHAAITGEIAIQLVIGLEDARLRQQLEEERALLAVRVSERTSDLSAANAELARAARLKDEFLSNMSHELRTPLNVILGRAELLREQIYGPVTSSQDAAVQSIEEASRHLLELINDILDLSKVEAGMLELDLVPVDIGSAARTAMRMVAQMAGAKQITLGIAYDGRVETIVADDRRLKQMLVNLLTNAVKFTPPGGRVGLEVEGDPEAQMVTLTIWDTGIGIDEAAQRRLFRPFVQLDSALNRKQEGTGLGLALVLRLAELHGGSVALESAPGAGSRFSIRLPWAPLSRARAMPAPEAGERAPLLTPLAAGAPRPLILLAEDHEENVRLLSDVLDAAGYALVVARNGAEAVAIAQEQRPALILMDIQMPVLDGLEATRRLRAAGMRATPIIALTALAMLGDRERCLAAGASAYLTKPVNLRTLLTMVREALAEGHPAA